MNVILTACLLLLLAGLPVHGQEIGYFYDDLGWLIGVVDQQGNAALGMAAGVTAGLIRTLPGSVGSAAKRTLGARIGPLEGWPGL